MNAFAISITLTSILVLLLGYSGVPLWVWSLALAGGLWIWQGPRWLWISFGMLVLLFNLPWLRRRLVTAPILQTIKRLNLLPRISDTERAAIAAGTVWIEGEFFSGQPNWQRIRSEAYPSLSPDIQAFLDGPVEQVCRMVSDWEIYRRKDLPPEVWAYLKQEGFLGLMIPTEYGGLGFSNLAYSAVMTKLASRSFTHVATVGVTNSLGPAKLLMRYGTPAQKAHYLPRLARGEEIPCFALTEPTAGSDAASITSAGIVFRGADGLLYLRLNWQKRYITLGAIATLIGLAVQLRDPDNLLGKGEAIGITCILVPRQTPGVVVERRHDPMGVPFYNSPIEGHDVVLSVDQIIGGVERAGQGWQMLMQSLAAGRGISFPATCTGVAKLVARITGAYTIVRQQFGRSIGHFEGIEEPLARIGGLTYLMEAARTYTCAAVDQGEQPSVISAIAKYNLTELSRQIINDGMDILGGAGICRGPRNLLANIYTATPISITVEGANILTRSLMIFGQGAIRCHPYVYAEIAALEQSDAAAFDRVFWPHVGFLVRNSIRAVLLSLSRGALARSPVAGPTARYYRQLTWAAATFAALTDLVLLRFGGNLKRREKLTGRFADVLSWLYLGSATLRRFEAEGCPAADLPLVDWALQYALAQIQVAFAGIFQNLPLPFLRSLLATGWRLNPLGNPPSDQLGSQVAHILQTPGKQRDRLTAGIFLPTDPQESLGRLERALQLMVQAEPLLQQLKSAVRSGQLPALRSPALIAAALQANLLTPEQADQLQTMERSRTDAIQVDSFSFEEYQSGGFSPPTSVTEPQTSLQLV